MHSIGNADDALTILRWVRDAPKRYGRPEGDGPEGWEHLGSGSFRSVWLSPEGVAYKVNHSTYDSQMADEITNLQEAWRRRGDLPEGCRLPSFQDYQVGGEYVIAVERIDGETLGDTDMGDPEKDEMYRLLNRIENLFKLWDMHGDNAMVDQDGMLVVVDFGG